MVEGVAPTECGSARLVLGAPLPNPWAVNNTRRSNAALMLGTKPDTRGPNYRKSARQKTRSEKPERSWPAYDHVAPMTHVAVLSVLPHVGSPLSRRPCGHDDVVYARPTPTATRTAAAGAPASSPVRRWRLDSCFRSSRDRSRSPERRPASSLRENKCSHDRGGISSLLERRVGQHDRCLNLTIGDGPVRLE